MKASELPRLPRCTFVGRDPNTNAVLRCARWRGHVQEEHASYKDVITEMAEALIDVRGLGDDVWYSLGGITIMTQARVWYERLVTEE